MLENLLELNGKIENAEMILLGIGDELSVRYSEVLIHNPIYTRFEQEIESLPDSVKDFVKATLVQKEFRNSDNVVVQKMLHAYELLWDKVKDKNIFVITTCNDDLIDMTDIPADRVVKPCGTHHKMQCIDGCKEETVDVRELYPKIEKLLSDMYIDGTFERETIEKMIPACTHCEKVMEHNLVGNDHYLENGYMEQWRRYTMWLQGTLNKNVCILELGEGFRYPTVIRWPFEKVTNLNRKAVLVRVNGTFPQISKEISDRAFSCNMNSLEFLEKITVFENQSYKAVEEDEDVKAE